MDQSTRCPLLGKKSLRTNCPELCDVHSDDSISLAANERSTWVIHSLGFAPHKGWPGRRKGEVYHLCAPQDQRRQTSLKSTYDRASLSKIYTYLYPCASFFTSFTHCEHIFVDHRRSLFCKETHFPAVFIFSTVAKEIPRKEGRSVCAPPVAN